MRQKSRVASVSGWAEGQFGKRHRSTWKRVRVAGRGFELPQNSKLLLINSSYRVIPVLEMFSGAKNANTRDVPPSTV